jgi:uncharacterized protein (DUF983 family)
LENAVNLDVAATSKRADLWTAVKRGVMGRCPHCGQGKLFRAYLKLSERCSVCNEHLGEIRADDGPAWATILIVGHLIVPFFVLTARTDAPDWVYYAVLFPITIGMTLGLLPRVKGVFVAVLWSLGIPTGVQQTVTPSTPGH